MNVVVRATQEAKAGGWDEGDKYQSFILKLLFLRYRKKKLIAVVR